MSTGVLIVCLEEIPPACTGLRWPSVAGRRQGKRFNPGVAVSHTFLGANIGHRVPRRVTIGACSSSRQRARVLPEHVSVDLNAPFLPVQNGLPGLLVSDPGRTCHRNHSEPDFRTRIWGKQCTACFCTCHRRQPLPYSRTDNSDNSSRSGPPLCAVSRRIPEATG